MEVRGVASQLRALQAGRGGGPREGQEETQEVGARRVMRLELGAGKRRRRGDDGRVRRDGEAQHVLVVVGEGGDQVRVVACSGCSSQLAVERVRSSIRGGRARRFRLQLQLPLGAGAVYKVQTSAKAVHALAHVVQ